MNLNPNEMKVLKFLAKEYSEEMGFYAFAGIQKNTGLDRRIVRLACRSLTRKGLARYARGLWNDSGEPRGSGYAASESGVNRVRE